MNLQTAAAEPGRWTRLRGSRTVFDGMTTIAPEPDWLDGAATPGVVNPKSGAIEMAPNIAGLGQLNVVGLLGEKLGSRVVLENNIDLALLGEIWHGCAQNVNNVAFLALGSGVGLGLNINGQAGARRGRYCR